MTREEAKTIIKEYLYNHRFGYIAKDAEFDRLYEAMKVAVQALEQEPKYCDRNICTKNEYNKISCDECEVTKSQEPSGDLISRVEAIKAIDKKAKRIKNADTLNGLAGAVGILFDLPSYNSINSELSEDAISRQAALDCFTATKLKKFDFILYAREEIKKLPSVKPQESYDFAKWVAKEIFDEWEYNKDSFAEIACRKLAKLGIVRAKGDEWELVEPQEGANE